MVKKIIVSHFNNMAAILQNNKIQEIITINNTYQVNDIYIGIVQKIFSSINAAFVKIGQYGKSGFIHISDIKSLKKERHLNHITDILSINQLVLVQVIKEPTNNKGPRLTTNINLLGKYVNLMPFCNTIHVSQKIYDFNEKIYLHSFGLLIKPTMMGILIKPSAEGISEDTILRDLNTLKNQWYFIQKAFMASSYPNLLYRDKDLIQKVIRDFYEKDIKKIIIDSEQGLNQVNHHLKKWGCISSLTKSKLQLYKKSECILEQFHIKEAISSALKSKVKLESGGHIVIENSEAFTVIDVNSGSFNKSDNSKETILRTNFYAAIEVAYQLKIRNLNGVIIIDFIDMQSKKDQLQLLEHFGKLLKLDDAKPQIVQLSELGLVELTRRRRGQSLKELFHSNSNYQSSTGNFKYLTKKTQPYLPDTLNVYKNINSLFFSKKFNQYVELKVKNLPRESNINTKYLTYFDPINTIYLFNPRANYIVPFGFYSEFIQNQSS